MAQNGPAWPVSRCPLIRMDRKQRAGRKTDANDQVGRRSPLSTSAAMLHATRYGYVGSWTIRQ
jgi:hypothetical protein